VKYSSIWPDKYTPDRSHYILQIPPEKWLGGIFTGNEKMDIQGYPCFIRVVPSLIPGE